MRPTDLVTIVVNSGEWDESKHPRDEQGKFTDAGGGLNKHGRFDMTPSVRGYTVELKQGLFGRTAATISYSVFDDGQIYVGNLETTPNQRGRGHAGRLLDELLGAADALGRTVTLESSPRGGSISQSALNAFYRSRGFEQTESDSVFGTIYTMTRKPKS